MHVPTVTSTTHTVGKTSTVSFISFVQESKLIYHFLWVAVGIMQVFHAHFLCMLYRELKLHLDTGHAVIWNIVKGLCTATTISSIFILCSV